MSLIQQVQRFVKTSNNQGQTGLVLVDTCVEHMFTHGDWTPLAWLLAKTDARDARIFRAIVGRVTKGVKLSTASTEAKNQPSGMVINLTPDAGKTNLYGMLGELIKDGESFRGRRVSEELLKREPSDFDFKNYVKRVIKKLGDEGFTLKDMLEYVAKTEKVNADLEVIETRPNLKPVAA